MKQGGTLYNFFNAHSNGALVRRDVLAPLRELAAQSPTATAALEWLEREKIDIVFDRKLVERKVMGRYNRKGDKRWISLSPKFMNEPPEDRLDTLVHEIRHAWQDANGVMLPYSFMFNMQYGLKQAFLFLCLEEADAHAHGLSAGLEAVGEKADALTKQVCYITWFNERMPVYLDLFIDQWTEFLAELKMLMADDPAKMKRFLDGSTDVGVHDIDVARLAKMGAAFGSENYMQDGKFHDYVIEKILPAAAVAYRVKQGDKIVELTAAMDDLCALAPADLRAPKAPRRAA